MLSRLSASSIALARRSNALSRSSVLRDLPRMLSAAPKITYTICDEAPALATYSLLPVVKRFAGPVGIEIEPADISLAGRIISNFPESLTPDQRQPDTLAALGELVKQADANIIKTPNVSASVPQLQAAIEELRGKGYNIPVYPANPQNKEEEAIKARYAKVLGSAVNPVLREGNSDRRVAKPVKDYAKKNPSRMMKPWSRTSKTHVAHMTQGDFYGSEKSAIVSAACTVTIEHVAPNGTVTVLKPAVKLEAGEVIDGSFMSARHLQEYFEREFNNAKNEGLLLSLHLKATMMKISDPVIFGHAVRVFFKDAFAKHAALFARLNVNPNNGLGDLYDKLKALPDGERQQVEADLAACYANRPALAMVDSGKGITNLHVPSDVIVDASMPVVVRDSGKMWNKEDKLQDTKCLIPDRCYATQYQEILEYCRQNGQFDPATMGNVCNVGLMARKAEEYGSHDKTFIISAAGTVRVRSGETEFFRHEVEEGDIWRMCQTKDEPIRDWVRLAVSRARITGSPAVFWLDDNRAHDHNILEKVHQYLPTHDVSGLDISIMPPAQAMRFSCERATRGLDTISVTGNVMRDYNTDMFPILELGTSAKMLSIVPLLGGGGLFETGAGGSAPKHVQQFLREGHLRWDSMGEYLALGASLEHLGETRKDPRAALLARTLNQAIGLILDHSKSPSRKVYELDNRGSNFYLCLYWARFMAQEDPSYRALAEELEANRHTIVAEINAAQGHAVDLGGYYKVDEAKAVAAMRPSATWNRIIDSSSLRTRSPTSKL